LLPYSTTGTDLGKQSRSRRLQLTLRRKNSLGSNFQIAVICQRFGDQALQDRILKNFYPFSIAQGSRIRRSSRSSK